MGQKLSHRLLRPPREWHQSDGILLDEQLADPEAVCVLLNKTELFTDCVA